MIRISGYSDDIVHIESDFTGTEEIDCHNQTVILVFKNSKGSGVEISMWYEGPTWAFTIMQLPDEEIEVPWPIVIDQESSYSLVLEIQAGEDISWTYEKENN